MAYPQPGVAYPQQQWAGGPSVPVRGRRPAAFILAGLLILFTAPVVALTTPMITQLSLADFYGEALGRILLCVTGWLVLAGAFALVATGARPAGRELVSRAAQVAGAAGLVALSAALVYVLLGLGVPTAPLFVLQSATLLAVSVTLIRFALRCRPVCRRFGVVTGTAAGFFSLPMTMLFSLGAFGVDRYSDAQMVVPYLSWILAALFLMLFGFAVAVGRLPVEHPQSAA